MELRAAVCPKCGANIEVPSGADTFYCQYCGASILLDDESADVNISGIANDNSLMERAFIFLGDGNFQRAQQYFDRVLDIEPKLAKAYWGLFMSQVRARNVDFLLNMNIIPEQNSNYNKAVMYSVGDEKHLYMQVAKKMRKKREAVLNSYHTEDRYENTQSYDDRDDYEPENNNMRMPLSRMQILRRKNIWFIVAVLTMLFMSFIAFAAMLGFGFVSVIILLMFGVPSYFIIKAFFNINRIYSITPDRSDEDELRAYRFSYVSKLLLSIFSLLYSLFMIFGSTLDWEAIPAAVIASGITVWTIYSFIKVKKQG